MSRPTFEACQDYPSCRDQKFFFSVQILKIKTFPVETRSCQNLHRNYLNKLRLFKTIKIIQDLSRLFKIYWDISTLSRLLEGLQVQKSQQTEKSRSRNMSIKIETNCQAWPKISGLNGFLNLNWDFWNWKMVLRQNWDFSISIETSWLSRQAFLKLSRFSQSLRQAFWNCQNRDSRL